VGCMMAAIPTEEAIATLVNIASLDRSEEEILSLPRIGLTSAGIGQVYQRAITASSKMSSCCKTLPLPRGAVAALVKAQTDADGRVSKVNF